MNLTETAKQSVAQRNEQRLSSELSKGMDQVVEKQLERVETVTKALVPVAQVIEILGRESKGALQEFRATFQDLSQKVALTLTALQEGARAIEIERRALTLKRGAWMCLANLLIAAAAVSAYSFWQQQLSGDRAAATQWRDMTARFQEMSPVKQRQVQQLIYGTPSR